jgi:hypothetical protein
MHLILWYTVSRSSWGSRANALTSNAPFRIVTVGVLPCTALLTQLPPARHIRSLQDREEHALHQPTHGRETAKWLLVQRQLDGKFPLDMPRLSW